MKIACVQMTTGCDPTQNLATIAAHLQMAAQAGAEIVTLPETCTFMEKNRAAMQARLEAQADMGYHFVISSYRVSSFTALYSEQM